MKLETIYLIAALTITTQANAQSYADSVALHRQKYKMEFVEEKNSPLKAEDTSYLRFFEPNEGYRVNAKFTLTPEAKQFDMHTHSGKIKPYRQYGYITFNIHDTTLKLEVYQSLTLIKDPKYKDHLFIPFNDMTNYETTYAGGRYIDISTKDIKNGMVEIDFNKAYNPYCAYTDGYNCPIPPVANRLKIAVPAGEKLYGKEIEE